MRNTLVPVLLLAAVSLSSCNILPILSIQEKPDLQGYGQSNENTFSIKHESSGDINDLFFQMDINNHRPLKLQQDNSPNTDDNAEEYNSIKDNIYDEKGFRKEQWHNYPRQLDRLNMDLYKHFNSDKRSYELDDPGEYNGMEEIPENPNDITSNEVSLDDSFDSDNIVDGADKAAALLNPLIILKIHLACLNKNVELSSLSDTTLDSEGYELRQNDNEDYNLSEENPRTNPVKVKREGNTRLEIADSEQSEPKNRIVNKRIFSLWSRLQSLNHKGHELHHRRHLYALYGLPDSEGGGSGGVLTAETRATFMRPPGSPLRWG